MKKQLHKHFGPYCKGAHPLSELCVPTAQTPCMKLTPKGSGDGLVLGVYAVLVQVRGDLAERCFAASPVRGQLTGPEEDLSPQISHVG